MSHLLLCHRRAPGVSCAEFVQHFRGKRREVIGRHQRVLAHGEYRQVYQTSQLNPLYRGIKLTRDPALLALLPRTGVVRDRASDEVEAPDGAANARALPRHHAARSGAGWDVVELLRFDSLDAMRVLSSPSGRAIAADFVLDQRRWAGSSSVMITDSIIGTTFEHTPPSATSTLFFLRAVRPLSRRAMLDYWGSRHKHLFLSKQSALGYGAYTQLHVRDEPSLREVPQLWGDDGEAPFDGVACVSYAGACRVALDFVSPRALWANFELVRDEVTFIDGRRSVLVFGAEERVS